MDFIRESIPPSFLKLGMNDLAKTTIRNLLKGFPGRESFLAKLEGWVVSLNRPESFYRRPELKPRSKEKKKAVAHARKLANRLNRALNNLRGMPLDLNWEDTVSLAEWRSHLPEVEGILQRAAVQARPQRTDKRLHFQRYALRGLMWLCAQYLPDLKISSAENSRFYGVAQEMLQQIGFVRSDVRELIRVEIQHFSETIEANPPAESEMGMILVRL